MSALSEACARALVDVVDWRDLAKDAAALRDAGWQTRISYSRKVFIPLTHLCRDVCHYCTFATSPTRQKPPYMSMDDALDVARQGARLGCKEALFTLGDAPERRYLAARDALTALGHASTIGYLAEVAKRVRDETGLLPHFNPGVLTPEDFALLRPLGPSMGIMIESVSERLCERGGPHFGSPDKHPSARLATIEAAGSARVPLTTGILVGIGETRAERIDALLAIRAAHERHGHIQEVIIQNFRAKPGTKMAQAPEPSNEEFCWTIAAARLVLGDAMSLQAPPNLYTGPLSDLIEAGINDWGGVSPLTPDFVNPEAAWPALAMLRRDTERAGFDLVERLTVYPSYVHGRDAWIDPGLHRLILQHSDTEGWARVGSWSPGRPDIDGDDPIDAPVSAPLAAPRPEFQAAVRQAERDLALSEREIAHLFSARGRDFQYVTQAANALREKLVGGRVSYVVTRNINYTNICMYRCSFCAFSKGKTHEHLRGKPYLLDLAEIGARVRDAWERGATEVCMQGGIHPDFDGNTYLDILGAAKAAEPRIHVHAFSPLEVTHGARTLGLSLREYLGELRAAGLGSLPGTAAEILHDDVRRIICPDKVNTQEWLDAIEAAHEVGLRTTSTIMFGHVERYAHWAAHLVSLRTLQERTGGITEFVPLPFVHMEAPMYLHGKARKGPTLREAVLMHAVARLAFGSLIPNIQVSWVKLGPEWAARCLSSGANDFGGTLMDESISRAAGASYGQEIGPRQMEEIIAAAGRAPRQRTTLYADASRSIG